MCYVMLYASIIKIKLTFFSSLHDIKTWAVIWYNLPKTKEMMTLTQQELDETRHQQTQSEPLGISNKEVKEFRFLVKPVERPWWLT